MKIVISKLENPVHSGDWHDKPLKWSVNGPAQEVQMFATKSDATQYKKFRRNSKDQQEAIKKFIEF